MALEAIWFWNLSFRFESHVWKVNFRVQAIRKNHNTTEEAKPTIKVWSGETRTRKQV